MENIQKRHYDIIVVGGGMVGATQAIALSQTGLKIAVVEKNSLIPLHNSLNDTPDIRISSLSLGTVEFLRSLGIFNYVEKIRSTPYSRLSTWENGFSAVNFCASDINKVCLGYMVENSILQQCLIDLMIDTINIDVYDNSKIHSMDYQPDAKNPHLKLNSDSLGPIILETKLIIGADGANSLIRKLANIGISGWDYSQSCMLITCKTDNKERDITWQEFSPTGPKAYLPLHDDWISLVWYDDPNTLNLLDRLNEQQLKEKIESSFPKRIGNITVFNKESFALRRIHAKQYYNKRVVLVGDAAHTINPLAGQGANIGFKDVEALTTLIKDAFYHGDNWYEEALLELYESKRKPQNLLMQTGMDFFYSTFSNNITPVKLIRNLVFNKIDKQTVLKNLVLNYALK